MIKNYIGEPDGMTEKLTNFLEIENTSDFDFSSLQPRIILGRKGSGKSLTIRKFAEKAHAAPEQFVLPHETIPPDLDGMVKFTAHMPTGTRTNIWQKVWDYAIHVSVATHLLFDSNFGKRFSNAKLIAKRNLKRHQQACLLSLETPTTVYSVVQTIVHTFGDYEEFLSFFGSASCTNFLNQVGQLSSHLPTICIYLDGLDEELRKAPSLIVDIARALFYVCFNFVRGGEEGRGRIHVIITIRDVIYSGIIRGEHGDRYKQTPHIVSLPWNPLSASEFCSRKIDFGSRKFPNLVADRSLSSPLGRLLGFESVSNEQKDFTEDVMKYVLRHVNCSPRALVTLGNRLFETKEKLEGISVDRFKDTVNDQSRELAETLIRVTSAYLVASSYDKEIGLLVDYAGDLRKHLLENSPFSEEGMSHFDDESIQSITDGFVSPIKAFISCIGRDVFSPDELRAALSQFTKLNKDYATIGRQHDFGRLENVLWAQGLLGVRRAGRGEGIDEFFFYGSLSREVGLPKDVKQYLFFPGLVDACNLQVVKGVPTGYYANV